MGGVFIQGSGARLKWASGELEERSSYSHH